MTKWLWQLKWAFVIAIFAGPALAYFEHQDSQRIQRIVAQGVEVDARIDEALVHHHRRGSDTYELRLSFDGPDGARYSEYVDISSAYADRILIGGDAAVVDHTQIKYLHAEASEPVVIVDDADTQLAGDQRMMWFGIIAAILGVVISPLWFWLEARNKKKDDEDIDATLARMRAGQQP